MRIAYLTGEYPRATDTFIQREVTILRQQGVEIYTFSIRRPGEEHSVGPEQQVERDRTVYLLPPNLFRLLLAHLFLLFSSAGNYIRALQLAWTTQQPGWLGMLYQLFYFLEAGILAREIQVKQIQHLHNHIADSSCSVAMLAAELGGFTFSFTLHGPYIFFEPYRWRIDEKIKQALFVCCISHFCRSQGMLFVPPDHWNRMHIVHCGVDPALFKPISHKGVGKRLLYVGRLAAAKGLPVLFESLVKLKPAHPDILLTVVGDGSDRDMLERMATELGLDQNVEFVGYKSQSEVRQYLQQTQLFVLPSFAEGVPVSLMEAMAAGAPVVASQIAGASELVEQGVSGYLTPPGDAIALANRIQALLVNPKLRADFGAAGRAKVSKEFNLHHEVAWLHRVMVAALQGNTESIRPPQVEPSPAKIDQTFDRQPGQSLGLDSWETYQTIFRSK